MVRLIIATAQSFEFYKNCYILVFEIILRVTENNSWQDAFLKVLPERKNATPVSANLSQDDDTTDSANV